MSTTIHNCKRTSTAVSPETDQWLSEKRMRLGNSPEAYSSSSTWPVSSPFLSVPAPYLSSNETTPRSPDARSNIASTPSQTGYESNTDVEMRDLPQYDTCFGMVSKPPCTYAIIRICCGSTQEHYRHGRVSYGNITLHLMENLKIRLYYLNPAVSVFPGQLATPTYKLGIGSDTKGQPLYETRAASGADSLTMGLFPIDLSVYPQLAIQIPPHIFFISDYTVQLLFSRLDHRCLRAINLVCSIITSEIPKFTSPTLEVNIIFNKNIIFLTHASHNSHLGLVDTTAGQGISELRLEYSTYFQGFILKGRTASDEPMIHIVVYGQLDEKDAVGQFLSDRKLYLQHPQLHDRSVDYDNPHLFLPPGEKPEIPEDYEPASGSRPSMTKLVDGVLEIFERAGSAADYPPVPTSIAEKLRTTLRSTLKEHQHTALSFMIAKETIDLENNPLWRKTSTSKQCSFGTSEGSHDARYRNTITQDYVQAPQLPLGGLLADEMGLGKTLVALALIAGSIPSGAGRKPTLILTPLSTLSEWEQQIKTHFLPETLRYSIYHRTLIKHDLKTLESNDVVLTTYETLVHDVKGGSMGCLKNISWHRVILDEAHRIKNRNTLRYKAVCKLKSRHRWCLTGTPIQNNIEDFGALLSFLRVSPFDQPNVFKKYITGPLGRQESLAIPHLRILVDATSLRRPKSAIDLGLAPRHDLVITVDLAPVERDLYNLAKGQANSLIQRGATTVKRSRSVLQLILRLRQICNHGLDLLPLMLRSKLSKIQGSEFFDVDEDLCECCGGSIPEADTKNLPSRLLCPHILCINCSRGNSVEEKSKSKRKKNGGECPLCFPRESTPTWDDGLKAANRRKLRPDHYKRSSKVEQLLKNLGGTTAKCVVFSSWTTMLDLVEIALEEDGLDYRRLDGSMNPFQRKKSICEFQQTSCRVFLASIESAGVGLNLTAASHVHILEPLWNPSMEMQAMDRVHRIGQTQPVHTYRYVVKDSIEEHIINLQRKKVQLVSMSFGSDSESVKRQRFKDIESILQRL